MTSIYTDDLETRIKRVRNTIQSRDYEGTTNLLTSDIVEILEYVKNTQKLVNILNIREESDSGRVFRPTYITSCRSHVIKDLYVLLSKLGVEN